MMLKIAIAVLIAGALLLLLWLLRGVMLTPVKPGKNQKLTLILSVSGETEGLERTVDALLWLIGNGTLNARVLIADCDMDDESRYEAKLLSRDSAAVDYCLYDEVADHITL